MNSLATAMLAARRTIRHDPQDDLCLLATRLGIGFFMNFDGGAKTYAVEEVFWMEHQRVPAWA
jgi:hypothetical protein